MKIDLLGARSFEGGQPHDQFAWLRENAPVYRHPEKDGPGFWAVTRQADLRWVSRHHRLFSNEPTIMIQDPPPGSPEVDAKMMLMSDPPHHTELRKLVSRDFKPKAAVAMAPRVHQLARQIVDEVIERGECDLVADVAGELPSYVIADLLGIPLDDGRELYKLTETIHSAPDAVPAGAQGAAMMKMLGYSAELVARKRAEPGADLTRQLLEAEIDGRRLSDMEFHLFFMLLVDAGGDTTRNLVAGGMLALMERPAVMARLMSDLEGKLPAAREELLRFVSPVVYMRRTVLEDTEIAGQPVEKGDKVALYYGSANRDPAAVDHPDALEIERTPNHHVAFGGTGAHFCLGAHLARVEIDAMLREILSRMKDLELTAQPTWQPSNFISGPRSMPVRFRPGRRSLC